MKITISSSAVKILKVEDCHLISSGSCLSNENFTFQIYVQTDKEFSLPVRAECDLPVNVYLVKKMKGRYEHNTKTDDYYIFDEEDRYPDLLTAVETLTLSAGETATLFVEIPADEKKAGVYSVRVKIGEEEISFPLTVLPQKLVDTDLIVTHWFHLDGICQHYGVEVFSEAFYERFKQFLVAYVKMGNTMLLIPTFTPALDTEVGGERLTTQLVKVEKVGEKYFFDFSEFRKYVELVRSYGIKYFELAHLFTQWGGVACPKIMVTENGEYKNAFGWDCPSDDPRYLEFLTQYFAALEPVLVELGIKENTYIHLTDEPSDEQVDKYEQLSKFVKRIAKGIKLMDALSHYEYAERDLVDLPAVSMNSGDLQKFAGRNRLYYYCVHVDNDHITNRYFHMPALRTIILGLQLYSEKVEGFLHWGFNFYNVQFSKRPLNPYEDTMAGGAFMAGDSFIVYPGEKDVEYSVRYFEITQAFNDYRLMKTVEAKIGREETMKRLKAFGVEGVHVYPHDEEEYRLFREELYQILG